jgi:Phosphotransferase enzyme family
VTAQLAPSVCHGPLRDLLGRLLGRPVALTELKYRPGRRHTLRAVGARRSAIVKVYASARAPIVAARLTALAEGPAEPRLPEMLHYEPALRAVVLSEVPGLPLRDALLRGDGQACRRAGAALGAWHRFWCSRSPGSLRGHTVERELEILERRAKGASPGVAAAVRSAMTSLSAPWPLSTAVHRDLYEEQILVGERIGMIDLDDAALGPPELDVGNLLAHVDLLGLRSGRNLDSMTDQLLDGYASSGPYLDLGLLSRCRALTRLRLACIHGERSLLELVR